MHRSSGASIADGADERGASPAACWGVVVHSVAHGRAPVTAGYRQNARAQ